MSGRTVISVRGLGKRYDLGETVSSNTLRDALAAGTRRLFRGSNGNHKAATDEFWALKDVSFDVAEGEVVGIIGHNGAGKSTLLKILTGITEPTEGEIGMRGRIGALLEVGTGFHQELSGRENIFMNGAILGMSQADIRRKFDEIVAFAGVERFLDTPVKRYSSGMLVRLGFAVAAHLDPEILVIDEVLAVGDTEFQRKCLGKMEDVSKSGRTILFVSHSMAAVEGLCSRCVLLKSGVVEADGAARDVIDQYRAMTIAHPAAQVVYFQPSQEAARPNSALVSVSVQDGGLRQTAAIKIGEDLVLTAHVDCGGHTTVKLELAFLVYDRSGMLIFKCYSRTQHPEPLKARGAGKVVCRINRCRLAPGTYAIGVMLQIDGLEIERASNVLSFEILPCDLYGTGKLPQPPTGVVLPEVVWSLEEIHHACSQ